MTDLADGVVYSRSGLTYQAQLLEQRGLVTRGPSPDDERSTVVSLTDAGRDVLAAVFPGHIGTVHGLLFAPITDDDAAELDRVLGRIREHLRKNPPRSAAAAPGGEPARAGVIRTRVRCVAGPSRASWHARRACRSVTRPR